MLRALLEAGGDHEGSEATPRPRATLLESFLGPFSARILIDDGVVCRAQAGPFHGEDALFRLLLAPKRPVRQSPLDQDIAAHTTDMIGGVGFLLDGFDAKVLEWERAAARVGGFGRVWAIRFAALKTLLDGLPADVKRVVRLADGTRDVRTLMAESPLSPTTTLNVLEKLLRSGALVRADVVDDVLLATSPASRSGRVDRRWQQRTSTRPTPAKTNPAAEPSPDPTSADETAATTASTSTTTASTASEEPSTSGPIARLTDSEPPASVHPEETLQTWLDDVDGEDFFRHAPNTQTQAATNRAGWPAWSLLLLVLVGGGVGMVLARACFG